MSAALSRSQHIALRFNSPGTYQHFPVCGTGYRGKRRRRTDQFSPASRKAL